MPTLADLFRERYLGAGVDFAAIRVHPGGAADQACRALGARAFTVGTNIYFADGAFRPDTRDGLWLLAHEVAHVVQQASGTDGAYEADSAACTAAPAAGLTVLPPGTAQERAADAAADALVSGRRHVFRRARTSAFSRAAAQPAGRRPVAQRYMAWEHSMLGDVDPELVAAAASGDPGPVASYRDLLFELGRAPRQANEAELRAAGAGTDTVRLPGSGLVVTLGELNVLPDYLGRPEEIEAAPPGFVGPLIQSVRSWGAAELERSARQLSNRRGPRTPPALSLSALLSWPAVPALLPGSLPYPLLGPLAESAEVAAISALGRRHGFAPSHRYSAVLARNAGHFAPFSWYRWHEFHLMARELIAQSATVSGAER